MRTAKHLERILSELDKVANHLEGLGFTTQSDALDKAGEQIEDVQERLMDAGL